jgi:aminoglycoside phosphotransferase family enzyme/predicted kinase
MDHIVQPQDEIFALLADPATHSGLPVRRIDTHAAAVFLVGNRALKVKRAVRFPFLDFSSLEKRKAACEGELEVNRAFAPAIYRRIVPITREADGSLALEGQGTPVEWAVEMRRFDETATLDRLAARGEIDDALADALGRAVALAHAKAPVAQAEPWINALAQYVEENDAAFRETPKLFPLDEIETLTWSSRASLQRIRPLLAARGQRGLVRRGHGDLHLGNIVLLDGAPVLFDAIEFDPLVATGDVLYELAFLLMDLVERGQTRAANTVLNRYLIETRRPDDLDGLTALPFCLSLRAAIRAKVTAAKHEQTEPEQKAPIARAAQTYFRLAGRLIEPPPPVLIAIGGLSGTGKSVLARSLAPELAPAPGAVLLRSDVERKMLFGKSETEALAPEAYVEDVTARVYAALAEKAGRVLTAGHSAVVDAVFAKPQERADVATAARRSGVRFHGLFLIADLATRAKRVRGRYADASDADAAIAQRQESYQIGALEWSQIDASGTPADTLRHARAELVNWSDRAPDSPP